LVRLKQIYCNRKAVLIVKLLSKILLWFLQLFKTNPCKRKSFRCYIQEEINSLIMWFISVWGPSDLLATAHRKAVGYRRQRGERLVLELPGYICFSQNVIRSKYNRCNNWWI